MSERVNLEDCERVCALAPVAYAPIRHHVFVCNGKSCMAADSAEVKEAFDRELKQRGLLYGKEKKGRNPQGNIVLTDCSSVGFCAVGAAVLVYPDGIWYAQVRAEDVTEIIEEHLIGGRVVNRLALLKVPYTGQSESEPSNGASVEQNV
jgi:(2Fe-2S) ferredoxin